MRAKPGYVETPAGEIHVWRSGAGMPLLLLHWAPASGRMYARALPHFAAAGFDAIAPDLPGFGRSHRNRTAPSVPEMAEDVLAAADALGLGAFAVVGGHLSASVAIEMARRAPARVSTLVLDGLMNLEMSEFATLVAPFAGKSPRPDADGKFRQFPVDIVLATLHEWNPDFVLDENSIADVYELLADYLQMGYAPIRAYVEPGSGPTPQPYPLRAHLPELRAPTLILTAEREALKPAYERSLAAIPGSRGHEFAGAHPLMTGREKDYVDVIAAFVREAAHGRGA
jgi:pimeloyl-ACP methyl ester carboxylesterase